MSQKIDEAVLTPVPDGALSNLAHYSHSGLVGKTGQIIFDWIGTGFTTSLLEGHCASLKLRE